MDLNLSDQWVLVTGSSRGIGCGIAQAFLREGAKVILSGRDEQVLINAHDSLVAEYGSASILSFAGDLQDPAIVQSLTRMISQDISHLHHLVCNIGSGQSVPPLAGRYSRI